MNNKLLVTIFFCITTLLCCTKQIDDSIIDVTESGVVIENFNTENLVTDIQFYNVEGEEITPVTKDISETQNVIVVVLPVGTSMNDLDVKFTVSDEASIIQNTSSVDFSSSSIKVFTVEAENGDTNSYVVKVTSSGTTDPDDPTEPSLSNENFITEITSVTDSVGEVTVVNQNINNTDNTLTLIVPQTADLSDLTIEFEISDAATIAESVNNLDFSIENTKTFTVTAENEATNSYTLQVLVDEDVIENIENSILKATIFNEAGEELTVIENLNTITEVTVPFGTAINSLSIVFELSELATLKENTLTEGLDFTADSGIKIFFIVAENGDEKAYAIEIAVEPISERQALLNMYTGSAGLNEGYEWDLSEGSDIGLWTGVTVNESGNVIKLNGDTDSNPFLLDDNLAFLPFLNTIEIIDVQGYTHFELDVFLPSLENVLLEQINVGLPEWIENQENLEKIECIDCGLESLSESIAELSNLTTLNLNDNPDLVIPQAICDWGDIDGHTLNIEGTLGCEGDVDSINIQKQALLNMHSGEGNWDFDLSLEEWEGITVDPTTGNVIGFSQGGLIKVLISEFDANLGDLVYLETLISSFVPMTVIPEEIGNLTALNYLQIGNSGVTMIPDSICNLTELEIFQFNNNALISIPDCIGELTLLKKLILQDNDINEMPTSIGDLEMLEELNFQSNNLIAIPDIGNLTSLRILMLSRNSIMELPSTIGGLDSLQTLELSFNSLSSLPDEVWGIATLQSLLLNFNSLSSISTQIGNLENLTELDFNSNSIASIPDSVGDLSLLTSFALGGNDLTSVPPSVGNLINLNTLNISGNDLLISIPKEVCDLELTGTSIIRADTVVCDSYSQEIQAQRDALLSMYNGSSNWSENTDMSEWTGVEVDETTGNVTVLTCNNNLSTPIDVFDENLGKLIYLKDLTIVNYDSLTNVPEGIENLTSLNELRLYSNSITSLEGIKNLPLLTGLRLYNNSITSFEGIENLPSLTDLSVGANLISSLAGLENFTSITNLSMYNNLVTSVADIEKLPLLTELDLSRNSITSLVGLGNLSLLTELDLKSNSITSLIGLENLPVLTELDLEENSITSITGVENLTSLTTLYLHSNSITSFEGIQYLTLLNILNLTDNSLIDISDEVCEFIDSVQYSYENSGFCE